MFLLDTNVLSELRKVGDGRADARVTAWISGHDAASLYISARSCPGAWCKSVALYAAPGG